ncbi:MAG: SH3 domain-containing protein [Anaerolineae bacterium]
MWRCLCLALFLAGVLSALSACNLSAEPPDGEGAIGEFITETAGDPVDAALTSPEPIRTERAPFVTPTPLPGLSDPVTFPTNVLASTPFPVVAITPLGIQCVVYTTYSGTDPANKLRLRSTPSANAEMVLLLPNNADVWVIPNTQEVEADGYHWLHLIYVDGLQNRYEGWVARDSYMSGGVRDPSVNTLRLTDRQTAC